MYKGYLKIITLKELANKEASGYSLMNKLSAYGKKPSAGSMYPLLNELESKGFITKREEGRKNIYSITPQGKRRIKQLMEKRKEIISKHISMCESLDEKKPSFRLDVAEVDRAMFRNLDLLSELKSIIYRLIKENRFSKNEKEIRSILADTIKRMKALK